MKSKIAFYWLTAARSGFVQPAEWRAWADRQVVSIPKPPFWIIGMSLARDIDELRKVLEDVLDASDEPPQISGDDPLLGYIWWRFERREINLRDCLELLGEAAEAGSSSIPCETIFALLNKLEIQRDEREVEAAAKELFRPHRRLAEQQWMEIQSASNAQSRA